MTKNNDAVEKTPCKSPACGRCWKRTVIWSLVGVLCLTALAVGIFLAFGGLSWLVNSPDSGQTQNSGKPQGWLVKPKRSGEVRPLDQLLDRAYEQHKLIYTKYADYSAIMTKRERSTWGSLSEQKMFIKVRNRRLDQGKIKVPFSVYLKFLDPHKDREVVWVENQNQGRLTSNAYNQRFVLAPTSTLAMMGNRYPISDIGIGNLIVKLVEQGEAGRENEFVSVVVKERTTEGRKFLDIEVKHTAKRPEFKFYIAKIRIDTEYEIPVQYAAYQWPEKEGGEPVLDEEYVYEDLKFNLGFTDKDFDPDNPDYKFPKQ